MASREEYQDVVGLLERLFVTSDLVHLANLENYAETDYRGNLDMPEPNIVAIKMLEAWDRELAHKQLEEINAGAMPNVNNQPGLSVELSENLNPEINVYSLKNTPLRDKIQAIIHNLYADKNIWSVESDLREVFQMYENNLPNT
jgi:hypothetical protein